MVGIGADEVTCAENAKGPAKPATRIGSAILIGYKLPPSVPRILDQAARRAPKEQASGVG